MLKNMSTNKPIYFALDYDDTYTRDPELWLEFIKLLQARGHTVRVATMRCEFEDDMDPRLTSIIPVDFCCGKGKKEALRRKGLYPDIWIDDRPDWICADE